MLILTVVFLGFLIAVLLILLLARRKPVCTLRAPLVSALILTWNKPHVLENSLKSYKQHGLDMDKVVFLQGNNNQERKIAEKYQCKIMSTDSNIGILPALAQMVETASSDYVIFLENDWELMESPQEHLRQAIKHIDNGEFDLCRLRHRQFPGAPLFSKGLGDIHDLSQDPLQHPHIKKVGEFYTSPSSHQHGKWTNNPFICKRSFLLRMVDNLKQLSGRQEHQLDSWWHQQNFTVAHGEGLFMHHDLTNPQSVATAKRAPVQTSKNQNKKPVAYCTMLILNENVGRDSFERYHDSLETLYANVAAAGSELIIYYNGPPTTLPHRPVELNLRGHSQLALEKHRKQRYLRSIWAQKMQVIKDVAIDFPHHAICWIDAGILRHPNMKASSFTFPTTLEMTKPMRLAVSAGKEWADEDVYVYEKGHRKEVACTMMLVDAAYAQRLFDVHETILNEFLPKDLFPVDQQVLSIALKRGLLKVELIEGGYNNLGGILHA